MTFKITSTHRYWWPVKVRQPIVETGDPKKSGGRFETVELKLLLEAMGEDEVKAIDAALASLPPAERIERQHEQLERVVKDWTDVVDEDNQPVPFSQEAFRQAMQRTWFRLGVYKAWGESLIGEAARQKN